MYNHTAFYELSTGLASSVFVLLVLNIGSNILYSGHLRAIYLQALTSYVCCGGNPYIRVQSVSFHFVPFRSISLFLDTHKLLSSRTMVTSSTMRKHDV
jgi:hypothetical protein